VRQQRPQAVPMRDLGIFTLKGSEKAPGRGDWVNGAGGERKMRSLGQQRRVYRRKGFRQCLYSSKGERSSRLLSQEKEVKPPEVLRGERKDRKKNNNVGEKKRREIENGWTSERG